jgi:hypothetical protein
MKRASRFEERITALEKLLAERVTALEKALAVAADDLDKAANQFEGLKQGAASVAEFPEIVHNPEIFAEKAKRAREALK